MRLFVYGTLLSPPVLARRSGAPLPRCRPTPATLRGWRRVALRGTPWPTVRRQRGARTPSLLIDVTAAALRRLNAWEGPAYRLTRVVVATSTGNSAAMIWIAPTTGARPWKG